MKTFDQKTVARFWGKVDRRGCGDCWNWLGYKNKTGHGQFYFNRKLGFAHRFSFLLHGGNFKDGPQVMHLCNNGCCVNPKHLKSGTMSENILYAVECGRHKSGLLGKKFNKSDFSERDKLKIRARYKSGEKQAALAKEFQVSKRTIQRIVSGHIEKWRKWA